MGAVVDSVWGGLDHSRWGSGGADFSKVPFRISETYGKGSGGKSVSAGIAIPRRILTIIPKY